MLIKNISYVKRHALFSTEQRAYLPVIFQKNHDLQRLVIYFQCCCNPQKIENTPRCLTGLFAKSGKKSHIQMNPAILYDAKLPFKFFRYKPMEMFGSQSNAILHMPDLEQSAWIEKK
jgi:hypothetical protein